MKKAIMTPVFFSLSIMGIAQSLSHRQIRDLQSRFMKRIMLEQPGPGDSVPAEYLEFLLCVDSCGRIESTHVLFESGSRGSICAILNNLPVSIFDGWEAPKASNKTLVFPIAFIPRDGCTGYILDLVNYGRQCKDLVKDETRRTIIFKTYIIDQLQ
jgi:hypothetical protein